jgi:hypothetical protein
METGSKNPPKKPRPIRKTKRAMTPTSKARNKNPRTSKKMSNPSCSEVASPKKK